jgi:flagellar biosynthesis/type III secretory pathway M-ring protein FliF/YscJ
VSLNRTWLLIGAVTAVVIVAVVVFLFINRPWESREYKSCLRTAQSYLGPDYDKSQIKAFCHEMYP